MATRVTQNRPAKQRPSAKAAQKTSSARTLSAEGGQAPSCEALAVIYANLFGNPNDTQNFVAVHNSVSNYVNADGPRRQQTAKQAVDELVSKLYSADGREAIAFSLNNGQMKALASLFVTSKEIAALSPSETLSAENVW